MQTNRSLLLFQAIIFVWLLLLPNESCAKLHWAPIYNILWLMKLVGWLSFLGCPVLAHEFLTPRGSLSIFLYLLQNIINILLTGFLRYVQKCM